MSLVLRSGPVVEPVSLSEVKSYLKVDGAEEDLLIASLILTSRLHIESALGLGLITQSYKLMLDNWPRSGAIRIPIRPVQAVEEIRVRDADGVATVLDAAIYDVDVASAPARIAFVDGVPPKPGRSVNGIEVDIVAGYGAAATDVPAPIRQGLMMLVAHWYEHRDPVEIGSPRTAIPMAVSNLIKPYRLVRL
ncbi:MAG: head-tail connector protein [Pseudomonadota bacterium]